MKKITIAIVVLALTVFGIFVGISSQDKSSKKEKSTLSSNRVSQVKKSYLFVPEWSLSEDNIESDGYDSLLYFGVGVNEKGLDTNDPGYLKVGDFIDLADKELELMLVIRMIDSETNATILRSRTAKEAIISESIDLSQKYSFDGIVLNFETQALGLPAVEERIGNLYQEFYSAAKKNDLLFYVTIFGDTYYRGRPYKLSAISNNADKAIIMAYDFHKSNGNPGPNFPLGGEDNYGYDFKKMISDMTNSIDKEKIVVAFGFFGYDWTVDDKGNAVEQASALSLNQANARFSPSCIFDECTVSRDKVSSETKVTYKDQEGRDHEVWFEDLESVRKKTEFLESQGINQVAHWAYSFF